MLKPLNEHVILKKETPEKKTKSGIILTSKDQESPTMAKVIAVGPGNNDYKMTVKKGDMVVFKSYATTDIEYQGESYLILKENDILAIVEGE